MKKLEATQKLIDEAEKHGGEVGELRAALAQLELEAENLKKKEENLKLKEKVKFIYQYVFVYL